MVVVDGNVVMDWLVLVHLHLKDRKGSRICGCLGQRPRHHRRGSKTETEILPHRNKGSPAVLPLLLTFLYNSARHKLKIVNSELLNWDKG